MSTCPTLVVVILVTWSRCPVSPLYSYYCKYLASHKIFSPTSSIHWWFLPKSVFPGMVENDFSRPTHSHFAHWTISTRHSAVGRSPPFSTIYVFLHLFMIAVDWRITVFSKVYNSLQSLTILVLKWSDLAMWTLFELKVYISCTKLGSLLVSHITVSCPERV